LVADNINWIAGEPLSASFRAQVKIRYSAKDAPANVRLMEGQQARVQFDAPQRGVTPGQAAVFYAGEVLLGGGIIV
jgi:tRNA-specific 2-thiouridylase